MMKPEGHGDDWWRGCSIYQIYPRSFQDTDGNGTGDLAGVVRRLPYVASLGVDAIWLSPFFTSPMEDMGYDVADYVDVDPMFGTLADFDMVVAEAHRLGLKVIIDQVLSHSSDRHQWFAESRSSRTNPRADWYVWADAKPDGTVPNNWLSVFGGPAWEWDTTRKQYYLHNFLASQPDFNFHNPEVQDALLDTVRFWLERGVDGFRLDTANFYFHDRELRDNPPARRGSANDMPDTNPYGYQEHVYDKTRPENIGFLKRFRALLDSYGARTSVGEIGDSSERSLRTVAEYTGGGDKLHMSYTFDLLSPDFTPRHVKRCVGDFEAIAADGWVCWAFCNHDVVRHVTRWTRPGENPDDVARFSIALMVALRGSICLYQGEELALPEADIAFEDLRDPYGIRFWPGFKGRDGCRTPMVWDDAEPNCGFTDGKAWLPIPKEHHLRSVSRMEADKGSILHHYRAALRLRNLHPALRSGSIQLLDGEGDVLSFIRSHGSDRMFCAYNFGRQPAEAIAPERAPLKTVFASAGAHEPEGGSVELPPLGWLIAEMG
jgi:alpha-glucosidase